MSHHLANWKEGPVVIVEDNPSSLANWYLTRTISLAESRARRVMLVKNMSRSSLAPVNEVPRWLADYIGPEMILCTRMGEANWLGEVRREILARADCFPALFSVTSAFEDYIGIAAQLAIALKCNTPIVAAPFIHNSTNVKDKSWMRDRWSNCANEHPPYQVKSILGIPGCEVTFQEHAVRFLESCPAGVIVKPRGMAASLAVQHVITPAQLAQALKRAQSADFPEHLKDNGATPAGVVVEEYIEGPEFSLEGVVIAGNAYLIAITEKHTGRIGLIEFAELAHVIPARRITSAQAGDARRLLTFATSSLGVQNAVVHLEAKLTKVGWRPIEIGLRPAGGRIPLILNLHAGIDLLELHARVQLGFEVSPPTLVDVSDADPRYSALIFGRTESHWLALKAEGYPLFSPSGDWCGRWGCAVVVQQSAMEIDRLLRVAGALDDDASLACTPGVS